MEDKNQLNRYFSLVVISGILWGTSFPAVSYGLEFIQPGQLLFMRFLFATICTVIISPSSIKKSLSTPILIITGLLNGLSYLFQFLGQQWVPAGQSSILLNSYAIFAPIFSYILLKERLTRRKIGAAVIGLIGVFFITANSSNPLYATLGEYILGVLFVLSAGVVWGLYATFSKKIQNQAAEGLEPLSTIDIFTATMIYSLAISTLAMIFSSGSLESMLQPIPLFAAIYLAIFCSIIPFFLYLHSINKIEVGTSTIILLLEVVVSYAISTIFLREIIGLPQIFGGVLLLGGIFLIMGQSNSQSNSKTNLSPKDKIPLEPLS